MEEVFIKRPDVKHCNIRWKVESRCNCYILKYPVSKQGAK